MDFAAGRALAANAKQLDQRQAVGIGLDADIDPATGPRAGESEGGHGGASFPGSPSASTQHGCSYVRGLIISGVGGSRSTENNFVKRAYARRRDYGEIRERRAELTCIVGSFRTKPEHYSGAVSCPSRTGMDGLPGGRSTST